MNRPDSDVWARELADCASRFARGDFAALGRLFDLSSPRLLRYAQTLTRSREDAEDAVQAAIVRLARNPQTLAAVQFPRAYLLKVVRHEALRIVGRRVCASSVTDLVVDGPPTSLALEQAEYQAVVRAALQRLPPEQAEVVVLKIWEGLTFQEIATVTGDSHNTVASRYRYALAKLAGTLQPLAEEVRHDV